ncbi:MAG: hypothetical protein R3208_01810 [Ketobacteraceae bacterium]|nr:hypothetical protein [Ketobacteraceae bacterium]
MLKIVLYLMVVGPGFLYFYVLSHGARRQWWQDIVAVFLVVLVYSLFIMNFYEDNRIGNLTFVISTLLLCLFCYKGVKNALTKARRDQ